MLLVGQEINMIVYIGATEEKENMPKGREGKGRKGREGKGGKGRGGNRNTSA